MNLGIRQRGDELTLLQERTQAQNFRFDSGRPRRRLRSLGEERATLRPGGGRRRARPDLS